MLEVDLEQLEVLILEPANFRAGPGLCFHHL